MSKTRVLKKDAIINVEIGTGFVEKLQQLYIYMIMNLKKEDLEKYQKLIADQKAFDEDWMEHLTTVGVLLNEITNQAEKQGQTYEQDVSS